jgi:hypothetical protein
MSGVNRYGQVVALANGRPRLYDADGSQVDLVAAMPAGLAGRSIDWDTGSASLNAQGRAMLWYSTANDGADTAPGILYWNGSELLLIADAMLNEPVSSIVDIVAVGTPELDRCGRSGSANDLDMLTFAVVEAGPDGTAGNSDDTRAIYLGEVPAP